MSESHDRAVDDRELEIFTGPVSVISQEIDVQIATSKRYPRRKDQVIASAVMGRATLNADIAIECIYNLPRDGKTITGPSIRFAEIVRSCYGNIRVAARFVRIDIDDKTAQAVICEAVAYDTELNDTECSQVRRSIMTSAKGNNIPRRYSADMIATTVMAAQAIARRNAILALVPKAVWIDGMAEVERVVKGDAKTLSERRAKMLSEFGKFDVTPKQLFAALGVETEHEIVLNDMPMLAGMWSALKEGEAAESVLGMIASNRARPAKPAVENPMANRAADSDVSPGSQMHKQAEENARAAASSEPSSAGTKSASATGAEQAEHQKRARRTKAEMEAARATELAQQAQPSHTEARQATPELRDAAAQQARTELEPQSTETRDRMVEAAQEQREAARDADLPDIPAKPVESQTGYEKALSYIGQFNGTAGQLMDWWRSIKDARKAMSFEEQGHISKFYNGKFAELQEN